MDHNQNTRFSRKNKILRMVVQWIITDSKYNEMVMVGFNILFGNIPAIYIYIYRYASISLCWISEVFHRKMSARNQTISVQTAHLVTEN